MYYTFGTGPISTSELNISAISSPMVFSVEGADLTKKYEQINYVDTE